VVSVDVSDDGSIGVHRVVLEAGSTPWPPVPAAEWPEAPSEVRVPSRVNDPAKLAASAAIECIQPSLPVAFHAHTGPLAEKLGQ